MATVARIIFSLGSLIGKSPNAEKDFLAGCFDKSMVTFGVMQPTGDRWGDNESSRAAFGENRGAEIDRIAGSPWMGREWCERAYLGNGPMPDFYHHLYIDEELQEVATRLGVFWQCRDLTQYHNHPVRVNADYSVYQTGHLAPLYNPAAWEREKASFRGSQGERVSGE